VTFFIIGLIAAGISLLNKLKPLRIGEVSEAFLSYHLLFAIGINNLINFVFHVFFGDVAAKFIGYGTCAQSFPTPLHPGALPDVGCLPLTGPARLSALSGQ